MKRKEHKKSFFEVAVACCPIAVFGCERISESIQFAPSHFPGVDPSLFLIAETINK
jgi:hypothetical protein